MDEFLKMDIFFFVTTIVVLCFGILASIALYYAIKILKSIDHVARNVSEESDHLREDISVLRQKVRDEGMKIKHLVDFFSGMHKRRERKTKVHDVE